MSDFGKWLLEVDIRWKNAVSALAGFLVTALAYLTARQADWFVELVGRGGAWVAAALVVVFVITFLTVWLCLTVFVAGRNRRQLEHEALRRQYLELEETHATLQSLSDWQRSFLLRLVTTDSMQIREWEIGGYEAVWGPEVQFLCAKGILAKHHGGVLEISRRYWTFLQAYWNRETGKLDWPPGET